MVEQIFTVLGDIVQGFSGLVVSMFQAVVGIFYTAPSGTETTGSLTIVGTLSLMALGTGLVIWAIGFIRRLIRVRTSA